jgi:hypothetical protein
MRPSTNHGLVRGPINSHLSAPALVTA